MNPSFFIFKVCIADVNSSLGLKTTDELRSVYGNESVTFVKCDVRSESNFEGIH